MSAVSNYIAKLGRVIAAVFCIDRLGMTGNPAVNGLVGSARRILAEVLAGMIMNQMDTAYRGGTPSSEIDRIIDVTINDAANILSQATNIAPEGQKYKMCVDYLMTQVGGVGIVS